MGGTEDFLEGRLAQEECEMIEATLMIALYCLMAAKKKTVFGQMTLRSTKALEYLKTTTEPMKKAVVRFTWIHKIRAETDGWDLPHWVMSNEKHDWVCILDVVDGIPFLVYQKSALRRLEEHLMKLESDGATVESKHRGQVLTVDLGDSSTEVSFWRNPNGGQYAPFVVQFEE